MDVSMKWAALTERRKEKLLDAHRDVNTDHDWWDFVRERLDEDMKEAGVAVTQMYFRGFWSQGDGAEFHGYVRDWRRFMEAIGKPELIDLALEYDVALSWNNNGRYCGADCVTFDLNELWVDNPYDEDDDPVRHSAWAAIHGEGGPLHGASEDMIDFLKDRMRALYRELDDEYDYLTSDEAITEYLIDFREDVIDEALEEQAEEETDAAV